MICESVRDTILNTDDPFDGIIFDKLNLDDEFDIDDARACFGAVHYIMANASSYKVSDSLLRLELEHLGLPDEHSQLLCKYCISPE